ncbi:protein YgfX [Pseudomonas wadenswilerensis]
MSSPSDRFECRWQGSRVLLALYLACLTAALAALILLPLPFSLCGLALCLVHAFRVIPRQILLTHPDAITGLRRDAHGWHLWSAARGWHAVQLRADSMALPGLVILRYRCAGQFFTRSQCIGHDALEPVQHRRLRLRLKFSRRRWAAAG